MLLLAVSSLSLDAEVILRYSYRGYFTVDRWGQGVLHHGPYHLFVGESAHRDFQPHRGKPLKAVVSAIDQPANPGAVLIKGVKEVQEVDMGFAEGLQISAMVERPSVAKGEGVSIRYKLTNSSGEPIKIQPHGYRSLSLAAVLVTNSPKSSKPIGYKPRTNRAYWYYSYAYGELEHGSKPLVVACHEITLKDSVLLKPKAVHEKTVTLGKELPSGNYEVFLYLEGSLEDRGLGPTSNRIAFDVGEVGAEVEGGADEPAAGPKPEG